MFDLVLGNEVTRQSHDGVRLGIKDFMQYGKYLCEHLSLPINIHGIITINLSHIIFNETDHWYWYWWSTLTFYVECFYLTYILADQIFWQS